MWFLLTIALFDYWTTLFWIQFMKTSFNIGLVEVESYIVSKNNICDYIFWPSSCFHLKKVFMYLKHIIHYLYHKRQEQGLWLWKMFVTKPNVYYTNCHCTNHNAKTCRKKKVNAQVNKPPRSLNYPCYICGITSHKSTNYPKFGEVETSLCGKTIENKPIIEVKVASISFN
jgi:hypothetical protein